MLLDEVIMCPCNVTHDSVTLIVTFLIIIIIIITVEAPGLYLVELH